MSKSQKYGGFEEKVRAVTGRSIFRARRIFSPPPTVSRSVENLTATYPVPDESAHWRVWRYGGNLGGERSAIKDIVSAIRPDDVFYDIGAQVGLYTTFVAQLCETVAVEPRADPRRLLYGALYYTGIDATVLPVAFGREQGQVESVDGGGTLRPAADANLRQVRPDTLAAVPAPTVLKIDVQGAEIDVLDGFGDQITDIRLIYAEPHPGKGTSLEALRDWLEREGFETGTVETESDEPLIKAVK